MKIICVVDSLVSGGAQRQMSLLACGLNDLGHQVELFLFYPQYDHFRSDIDASNIPVHGVERNGNTGFSLSVLWALRSLMTQGFDAVISFQPNANIYATVARLLLLGGKKPKLICGERTVTAHYSSAATRVGVWLTGLGSDNLVTNSYTQAQILRQLPGLEKKVRVIWNGYRVSSTQLNSFLLKPTDQLRILVVGRQSSEKNGTRLLEALQIFYDRYGWSPQLRWAGRQEQDDASLAMKATMERFLEKFPRLATRCSFLGEVKDVSKLYASSDVLILPSLYEGLPNAVCEAMLAGCPVIASNVCDLPRLLGLNEERGLLCDPVSSESIADAIYRFHTMTLQEKASMIQRAHRFVKDNLSLERMVKSYEGLLEANSPYVY